MQIDTLTRDGDELHGPLNPHDRGEKKVALFSTAGTVWSVRAFAARHIDVLAPFEREIVGEALPILPDEAPFATPVSRSPELAVTDVPVAIASRNGARSAYLERDALKLKGCRPVLDGSDYPVELFPVNDERISEARVPFGVLTVNGAMREILAWCCWQRWHFETHSTPVAVFVYEHNGVACGVCLALRTVGERRIDEFLAYPACSVREIAEATHGTRQLGTLPVGGELPLRGVNLWWYAEQKAQLLSTMHVHGGFRGVLNSNIGNDVIVRDRTRPPRLFLCDFDSFAVCRIPQQPSREFLQRLVLHAIVEVVKGSISILEYANLDNARTADERRRVLAGIYTDKSTLWRAYWRSFKVHAQTLGWSLALLDELRDVVFSLEPVEQVLEELILNSHYLTQRARGRGVFYPHN